MRRTRFDTWPCPIARATDLIGDWWTPIILRNAFAGERRFEQFQESLGVSRAILADRLHRLVKEGLMKKVAYSERPARYEYRLTEKGRDFWQVLAAMWRWGEEWLWEDGKSPVMLINRDTGEEIVPTTIDANTGEKLDVRKTWVVPRGSARMKDSKD